jgi:hypothetical protein
LEKGIFLDCAGERLAYADSTTGSNFMDKDALKTTENGQPSSKPRYTPPDFESEDIFERRALACGKCRSGPHMQYACMRLPSVS